MRYRILVVGLSRSSPSVGAFAEEELFAVTEVAWGAVSRELLREKAPHLVVVGGGYASAATAPWLSSGERSFATLAVFETGRCDGLLVDVVDDFVVRGDHEELLCRAMRLLRMTVPSEADAAADRLCSEMGLRQLVGSDLGFVAVLRQIVLYARTDTPVLILGETGTGKELCARALHHLGRRGDLPFVAADCSGLPDHLFENEMFGHARGAYTDAASDQKGLVALADRGTLFLDEIDSLSLAAQGKLLRLLQEKSFRPLGSEKFLRANLQVIAATNADLAGLVRRKEFRTDLFYRLDVLQIRMPPLRERRGDIPQLARHFLREAAERTGSRRTFTAAALRKLGSHDWPGNVRELSNVVQRAAVLAEGEAIQPSHITLPVDTAAAAANFGAGFRVTRQETMERFERDYLKALLEKHDGNISRAARQADYERRAFGRLARKYHLTR
jgi:DNA-binding NtrC family response regulator